MSKPVGPRGAGRAVGSALVIAVLVGLLVAWLRATAPVVEPGPVAVAGATAAPGDVLRCADLATDEGSAAPTPGRAHSGEVLACPSLFDRMVVEYVGEVVGDVLERDGGAWVLVNDDDYALVTGPLGASGVQSGTNSGLSVWLPDPFVELVDEPGRAGVRGDVLRIVGVVHRADTRDGGGLTLRATDAAVLAEAVELDVPLHTEQLVAALVLTLMAIGLTVRDRRDTTR